MTTTTIQLDTDIVDNLKGLREQYKVHSYNELLKIIIKKARKPEKSMWGYYGKMSMKEILDGLRDETDRY
ncbi:MAG: hypothetical protein AABW88_04950 [Nanoarchaeota archaeon]